MIDNDDVGAGLRALGVTPALIVGRRPMAHRAPHRVGEVVFLANPLPEQVTATISSSSVVAWDPVTLRREPLPVVGERCRLTLPALGSVFLVPGGPIDEPQQEPSREIPLTGEWRLILPGVGDFLLSDGPRPWTELGPGAAAFAGVGTYATEVDVDGVARRWVRRARCGECG